MPGKEVPSCRGFGSTHLQSPSTVTAPVPARVWTIRWASEGRRCTGGWYHGIQAALDRAKDAARGKDVRLGGGVATVRQFLTAGLIDELHLAISPVLLGRGEHLLAGIDTVGLGYTCTEHASTDLATHVVLAKSRQDQRRAGP